MTKRRVRALKEIFSKLRTTDGFELPESSWRAFKRAWVRRGSGIDPFVVPKKFADAD